MITSVDRRRFRRVPVTDNPRLPPNMLDISLGGFSIELSDPLASDTVQEVRLASADGEVLVLQARVAYARQETRDDGRSVYITGLQFLADLTGHVPIVDGRLGPRAAGRRRRSDAGTNLGSPSA